MLYPRNRVVTTPDGSRRFLMLNTGSNGGRVYCRDHRVAAPRGKPGPEERLLDLPLGLANALAAEEGLTVAVLEEDGELRPVPRDVDPARLNVVVANGRVQRVLGRG